MFIANVYIVYSHFVLDVYWIKAVEQILKRILNDISASPSVNNKGRRKNGPAQESNP